MTAQELVVTLAGLGVHAEALCVWCLDALDPHETLYSARRAPAGGDCYRCAYTGRDVFAAAAVRP